MGVLCWEINLESETNGVGVKDILEYREHIRSTVWVCMAWFESGILEIWYRELMTDLIASDLHGTKRHAFLRKTHADTGKRSAALSNCGCSTKPTVLMSCCRSRFHKNIPDNRKLMSAFGLGGSWSVKAGVPLAAELRHTTRSVDGLNV